jgi:hypothetical protein
MTLTITLIEDRAAEIAALEGTFLGPRHYDLLVDQDALVLKPNGEHLFRLVKSVIPPNLCQVAYRNLVQVGGQTVNSTNRKTAIKPESGDKNSREGFVGFMSRQGGRLPYCRESEFNINRPELFSQVLPYFRAVNEAFRMHEPARYETQMTRVRETVADWIISGTAFSTVTVNRTVRTAAHYDKGDLPEGVGVITATTRGLMVGGELIFPRYRAAVKIATGDVLLADVHEMHGNAAMHGVNYTRLACVFYYRTGMQQCLSRGAEDDRVNRLPIG